MEKKSKNNKSFNSQKECNNSLVFILNKIRHKPLIFESIFSFTLNRPYILLDFIEKDKLLKKGMKKFFVKTKLHKNELSSELNFNLNIYMKLKNYYEIIKGFNLNVDKNKNVDEIKNIEEKMNKYENKAFSNIGKIMNLFKDTNEYEEDYILIKDLLFDYITNKEKFILYITKYNLDYKYLNYIRKINIKQKIELICIIDRFSHQILENNKTFYIDIFYPYIISLNFILIPDNYRDDKFRFYNIPMNQLFNCILNYFVSIKKTENIKQISFNEEFFLKKNKFISYEDDKGENYQSIISYLINGYLIYISNRSENLLTNIYLNDILLHEEKIDNIYERFKILYFFNLMFPKLKNTKILNIKYNEIINYNNNIYKISFNNVYKIFIIDFCNEHIFDLDQVIHNINLFIINNKEKFINIEIISFCDFQLVKNKDNSNNIDLINSNTFIDLPNL